MNSASGPPARNESSPNQRGGGDLGPGAFRYSVRGLFLALTCLAVLFSLGYYLKVARDRARWHSSSYTFKTVGLALSNFNDTYRSLPHPIWRSGGGDRIFTRVYDPNGAPLSSWRFSITVYMSHYPPSERRDKPWDSIENREFVSNQYWWEDFGYGENGATKMFAITGPRTAFGDGAEEPPRSLDEIDADTILVVEVRNSGVHWMQPGDFDIRTMPRSINAPDGRGISSRYRYGFHVIFADGEVWGLSHDTPFEELEKFFTIDGAKQHDRDIVLRPYVVR